MMKIYCFAISLGAVGVFVSIIRFRALIYNVVQKLLSSSLNTYLLYTTRIHSINTGQRIPTCQYVWPNGQGDVGKFLEGEKNRDVWARQHGAIYQIWNGMTPEIVVSRPEDIRAVFKDSDQHTKAENNNSGWLMKELLGQCLGLISGPAWRGVHSVISVHFTRERAQAYLPQMRARVKEHFHTLIDGCIKDARINPVKDLRFLCFNVFLDIIYGELDTLQRTKMESILPLREALFRRMIQGGITRSLWSQFLAIETTTKLNEFKRQWKEFNIDIVLFRKASGVKAPIMDMFEAVEQGTISLESLLQTLDEMLFANLDVTVGSISWAVLLLANDQTAQESIRREIHEQTMARSESRTWTEYIVSPRTLLHASILESARLRPLSAFSVPQSAPTDRIIAGYRIPAGTNFIVDTYALNICNAFWGDGGDFRPSRFLERKPLELRYQYWRFGFGPRQCIGKYAVDLLMRSILAQILGNFRLGLLKTTSMERNPVSWLAHADTEVRCETLNQEELGSSGIGEESR